MAVVWLDQRGWEDGDLPDVCMECGGEAPDRVRKTFVWQPSWVVFTIFVHVLLFLIVSVIVRKKRTALVPMCREHRNHWRRRTLLLWASLAAAVGVCVLGIFALNAFGPADPFAAICGVVVLTLIAWIVGVVVIQWGTIRPTEIKEESIGLKNVSPEFVDAYENHLDEEDARYRRKIQLAPDVLQRWNEPRRKPRADDDDDTPPTDEKVRPR